MKNKKGFTLVELVIVIAVIAILAGVMIAVFSGVVNDARESADLQKLKNEELAMKADDIIQKLNDDKWFGWEDLEVALANGISKSLDGKVTSISAEDIDSIKTAIANLGTGASAEQITAAIQTAIKNIDVKATVDTAALEAAVKAAAKDSIKAAFEEYKAAQGSTALTEEQIRAIVKGCFTDSYTGVTEEQMKTIINNALDSWTTALSTGGLSESELAAVVSANTVSKRDVQTIVDTAIANKLNTAQASVWVSQIKNQIAGISSDAGELAVAVEELKTIISNTPQLTADDITALLESSMPVSKVAESAADIATYIEKLVSGSTIVVAESAANADVVVENLGADSAKTLYFKGAALNSLTINAPAATVYVYNDVANLDVQAVAMHSLYTFGKVTIATVATGHVVFAGNVQTLTVAPTVAGANVEVAATATVTKLNVNTKEGGATLVNNGTVAEVAVDDASVATFIIEGNKQPETISGTKANNIVVDENNTTIVATVETAAALQAAVTDVNKKYIKLGQSFEITTFTVAAGKDVTLDTNGFTLTLTSPIIVTGKLTVIGSGKIVNDTDRVVKVDGGTFVLNDATLETDGELDAKGEPVSNVGAVRIDNGTVIMNSGKIVSSKRWWAIESANSTLKINGGTIEADFATIGTSSSRTETIVINGGIMSSKHDNLMYLPDKGTLTINGGELILMNGYAGIDVAGGFAYIHGGTFKVTGDEKATYTVKSGESTVMPVAFMATYKTTAYTKPHVEITGGTFSSTLSPCVVALDTQQAKGDKAANQAVTASLEDLLDYEEVSYIKITGGFFSSDVSQYVADGYTYDALTGDVTAK